MTQPPPFPTLALPPFYFTAYPNQTSSDPASPNYYAAYTGASAAIAYLVGCGHGGCGMVTLCIGHWQAWCKALTLSNCGPARSYHCCLQITAFLLHASGRGCCAARARPGAMHALACHAGMTHILSLIPGTPGTSVNRVVQKFTAMQG